MKRFKKILLLAHEGTGQRATLARAEEPAKRNRARLTPVEVVEQLPRDLGMLVTTMLPVDLEKLVVEERKERLEALVAQLIEGRRVAGLGSGPVWNALTRDHPGSPAKEARSRHSDGGGPRWIRTRRIRSEPRSTSRSWTSPLRSPTWRRARWTSFPSAIAG
jgi:hypothetical protein